MSTIASASFGRVAQVNHRQQEYEGNASFGLQVVRLRLIVDCVCGLLVLVRVEGYHHLERLCCIAKKADEQAKCSVGDTR